MFHEYSRKMCILLLISGKFCIYLLRPFALSTAIGFNLSWADGSEWSFWVAWWLCLTLEQSNPFVSACPLLCSHQWNVSPCMSTPSPLRVLLVFCPLNEQLLEERDSIFNPHHFAFNTGLGKHLDLNHAVCSVVSGCPNISFLNYEMG